jgi:hypothetical protein
MKWDSFHLNFIYDPQANFPKQNVGMEYILIFLTLFISVPKTERNKLSDLINIYGKKINVY